MNCFYKTLDIEKSPRSSLKAQKLVRRDAEAFGNNADLDVGHKALARFYALYGVFVDIEPEKLEAVRKLTLREPARLAQARYLVPADIVFP